MSDDDQPRQDDSGRGAELEIPRERAIEQRPVPFLGDELAAAMTAGGAIYIALPGMCRALGLGAQAQFQRIQRTAALAKGLRVIPLDTRGGVQSVNCLRVDRVALWLAGVEPSRVKSQFRPKIEAYQDELAPVAMQVFLRIAGVSEAQLVSAGVSVDPAIRALTEQIDELSGIVAFLREHLAALLAVPEQMQGLALRLDTAVALLESLAARQDAAEGQIAQIDARTQRLTPAHARAVQEQVNHMVRATAHLPTPLTFVIIYGRLKHRFRAGSYGEIPDERFGAVIEYLHEELRRATNDETPRQGSLL